MTWVIAGTVGVVAFGLGLWFGTKTSNALLETQAWEDGRMSGLGTAYHAAKAALDAPSKGKPGRSIVGRAIVRKLRALAEVTGDAS